MREKIFRFFTFIFILAAVYHALALIFPAYINDGPLWRHTLFIFINLICALFMFWRKRWFIIFLTVLTIQQLYSHGLRAWLWWYDEHHIDYISIGVVIFFPVVFTFFTKDILKKQIP